MHGACAAAQRHVRPALSRGGWRLLTRGPSRLADSVPRHAHLADLAARGHRRGGVPPLGPGRALAVWFGATAANASIGGPLWVAACVGVGNTGGTGVAAWLLRRWNSDDRLQRRHDVAAFLAAVAVGTSLASLNGAAWLRLARAPESAHFGPAWLSWMVGDGVGALLAGVPLIAWSRHGAAKASIGREGLVNPALQAIVLSCGLAVLAGTLDRGSALAFPLLALPSFVLVALLARCGGGVASSTGWGGRSSTARPISTRKR